MLVATSFAVLLLWIPLREKPGIGTVANALLIGPSTDATLALLDRPEALLARVALMLGGVALCGLATAMYIGAVRSRST